MSYLRLQYIQQWLAHAKNRLYKIKDKQNLMEFISLAANQQVINTQAVNMIEGVLQVSELQVRDIMIPRNYMVVVQEEELPSNFLPFIIESGHSRFPVISKNGKEVVGILLAKDLLRYVIHPKKPFEMQEYLRPAVFIPETKHLDILLQEFRLNQSHMAIIVDEYANVTGLITIEDVLEQIVGDIADESDENEDILIKKYNSTQFVLKGSLLLKDFQQYFGNTLHKNMALSTTLSDFLKHHLGYLPKRGEIITIERFRFTILRVMHENIALLRLKVLPGI